MAAETDVLYGNAGIPAQKRARRECGLRVSGRCLHVGQRNPACLSPREPPRCSFGKHAVKPSLEKEKGVTLLELIVAIGIPTILVGAE
ncbi:MAG: hypothetical protein MZV70_41210 [Desulfobacterales bacterium]|nr:hypothetical protein [Desulfobacterales bacterium]